MLNDVIEVYFEETWSVWVNYCRWPIVVVFLAWLGVAIWQTTMISALTEKEDYMPASHATRRGYLMQVDNFTTVENSRPTVTLFWGVQGLDKSTFNQFNVSNVGDVVLDSKFNAAKTKSQEYLANVCDALKSADFVVPGSVDCWLDDFKVYLAAQQ